MEEQLKGKTMTDDEAIEFVSRIGRCELFDELDEIEENKTDPLLRRRHNYPFYLKAIRVSLVTQGYDEHWVDSKFRDVLEAAYLGYKPGPYAWERGSLTKIKNLRKRIVSNMKWAKDFGRTKNG